ncbi:branched-chain amino acid ABC transporter permease [Blastococcus sp. TF02A-26]|uniref:branched-chain amino acid ABC transporter permease n=1 Tax=Blastococcus sp. TF02A-26 TaxID=2250577 RepID=UPI000DE81091|nr:branched-chain amino acid ABC transporter permease [Blastococcus sp. TF02A-26]RBY90810.1 branched-chain amino acid ABC transporter permease [Blastococcus sp. TF02A-26]
MSATAHPTTDVPPSTGSTAVPASPPSSSRRRGLLGALPPAVVLVVLAFVPFFLAEDPTNILTRILVFGLFAVSLDLLVGITGLPSLGHAAYFGVGAYTAALVADHWTPSAPTPVLMAAAAGAVAAVLTGWLAVRSHGVFFLMLTLAIGEITSQLALQLDDVTGGSNGMSVPSVRFGSEPFDADFRIAYTYWYVLVVFVIAFAAMWLIARSPFGLALRGIRDNEGRMRSLGYTPFRYKYVAYVLAGGFAGLAGGLFAQVNRLVSPVDAGFALSAITLLALVLGGAGTLWGPVLGMAVVVIVRDYYGPDLNGHGPLVLGIVFVIAVYVLPRGFAGIAGLLRTPRRRRDRSIVPGEERAA